MGSVADKEVPGPVRGSVAPGALGVVWGPPSGQHLERAGGWGRGFRPDQQKAAPAKMAAMG